MEESLRIRPKSPPSSIDLQVGYDEKGMLLSLQATIELDGGCRDEYCHSLLQQLTQQITGPYIVPHIEVIATLYTQKPTVHRPLRDIGSILRSFALERSIDQIAKQIHLDALSIRIQNIENPSWKTIL